MQFDEFDKKVKQAADHHHPSYDEGAWTKMEKLLNKHLPKKEDDRRKYIFLVLLFIGLGGAGLFIAKPWKKNSSAPVAEKTVLQDPPVAAQPLTDPVKEINGTVNTIEKESDDLNNIVIRTDAVPDPSSIKQQAGIISNKISNKIRPVIAAVKPVTKKEETAVVTDKNWWDNKNDITKNEVSDKNATTTANPVKEAINTDKKQNEPAVTTTKPSVNEPATNSVTKNENQPVTQNTDKKIKGKSKKVNSFMFTLSAGPDLSFVANGKRGDTKLLAGAGLGYTFNDRFTVRTGFYTGRKIYTAPASAYHGSAAFYTYYPNLEKVEADCKVYEIPLSLSYNFARSSKQNFFASAGVSSYLMKRETYNYFYKYYPTSPTVSSEWTVKDKNNHLFSSLTLSGGYQRNFGKHITMMAEPYLKLPISGVGEGKVKLNSAGVLFTVGIKPFEIKKEKPRN